MTYRPYIWMGEECDAHIRDWREYEAARKASKSAQANARQLELLRGMQSNLERRQLELAQLSTPFWKKDAEYIALRHLAIRPRY